MSPEQLRTLLQGVQAGDVSIDTALDELKRLPFDDLGFAKIDHHRPLRTGAPEERDAVLAALPAAQWYATARAFVLAPDPAPAPVPVRGTVVVCTGGTSD